MFNVINHETKPNKGIAFRIALIYVMFSVFAIDISFLNAQSLKKILF